MAGNSPGQIPLDGDREAKPPAHLVKLDLNALTAVNGMYLSDIPDQEIYKFIRHIVPEATNEELHSVLMFLHDGLQPSDIHALIVACNTGAGGRFSFRFLTAIPITFVALDFLAKPGLRKDLAGVTGTEAVFMRSKLLHGETSILGELAGRVRDSMAARGSPTPVTFTNNAQTAHAECEFIFGPTDPLPPKEEEPFEASHVEEVAVSTESEADAIGSSDATVETQCASLPSWAGASWVVSTGVAGADGADAERTTATYSGESSYSPVSPRLSETVISDSALAVDAGALDCSSIGGAEAIEQFRHGEGSCIAEDDPGPKCTEGADVGNDIAGHEFVRESFDPHELTHAWVDAEQWPPPPRYSAGSWRSCVRNGDTDPKSKLGWRTRLATRSNIAAVWARKASSLATSCRRPTNDGLDTEGIGTASRLPVGCFPVLRRQRVNRMARPISEFWLHRDCVCVTRHTCGRSNTTLTLLGRGVA